MSLVIGLCGCITGAGSGAGDTTVSISIDLSQLSAAARNKIDTFEVTASGALPLQQWTFTTSYDGGEVAVVQDLADDLGPVKTSGTLYLRVEARDSTGIEVASETRKLEVQAGSGPQTVTFSLKETPNVNGCKVYQAQSPVFGEGVVTGGFDVSFSNGKYFIGYVDRTGADARVFSAVLNSNGTIASGPNLLDADLAAGSDSSQPVVLSTSTGNVVAWERLERASGQKAVVVMRTDESGAPLANTRQVIAVGTPEEVRPTLAKQGNLIAMAWGSSLSGSNQLVVGTFDATTLAPVTAARVLNASGETGNFVGLAAGATGFAALWTSHADPASPEQVQFSLLSDTLVTMTSRALTQRTTGTTTLTRLTATPTNYLGVWEDTSFAGLDEVVPVATIGLDGQQSVENYNVDPAFQDNTNWPNLVMGNDGGVQVYYQFYRAANEGPQIFLTRIGSNGAKLGSTDIQISQNFEGVKGARFPDVVSVGAMPIKNGAATADAYSVFWSEEHGGAVSRLMKAGVFCETGFYGDAI